MKRRYLGWSASIIFGAFYLAVFYALNFLRPSEYSSCDVYTKDMNGGVHVFEGGRYRVELCGILGHTGVSSSGIHDSVRLQVFAMDGELLAERFFQPTGMVSSLEYDVGSFTYFYEKADMNQEEKITMPPCRWEWIRARLPRLWW